MGYGFRNFYKTRFVDRNIPRISRDIVMDAPETIRKVHAKTPLDGYGAVS